MYHSAAVGSASVIVLKAWEKSIVGCIDSRVRFACCYWGRITGTAFIGGCCIRIPNRIPIIPLRNWSLPVLRLAPNPICMTVFVVASPSSSIVATTSVCEWCAFCLLLLLTRLYWLCVCDNKDSWWWWIFFVCGQNSADFKNSLLFHLQHWFSCSRCWERLTMLDDVYNIVKTICWCALNLDVTSRRWMLHHEHHTNSFASSYYECYIRS